MPNFHHNVEELKMLSKVANSMEFSESDNGQISVYRNYPKRTLLGILDKSNGTYNFVPSDHRATPAELAKISHKLAELNRWVNFEKRQYAIEASENKFDHSSLGDLFENRDEPFFVPDGRAILLSELEEIVSKLRTLKK